MPAVTLEDYVLDGLGLPETRPGRAGGRLRQDVLEEWLAVTEQIMGRGVDSPSKLAKLLDVSPGTARRWIEKIKARWAAGMDRGNLNWRREALYREADEVSRLAWASALATPNESVRSRYLDTVLKANDRKARLCGIDNMRIEVHQTTNVINAIDVVAKVEQNFALPPGALAELGKAASLALTEAARGRLAAERPELALANLADSPVIDVVPIPASDRAEQGVAAMMHQLEQDDPIELLDDPDSRGPIVGGVKGLFASVMDKG